MSQIREIVLDTETTGLDPARGDRIVEIGAVELINHVPTGQVYHQYINPERDVPAEAIAVHGLTLEFLKNQPTFAVIADDFVSFIGDAPLIIHNADFDMAFLNAELSNQGRALLDTGRIVDTLRLARQKFPMGPNSLDALCRRFGVDNTKRTKHGALLDSELLAEVYLELIGGRQTTLALAASATVSLAPPLTRHSRLRERPSPLQIRLTEEEKALHKIHVDALGSTAIWNQLGDS